MNGNVSSSVVNSRLTCPTVSTSGSALTRKHDIMVNAEVLLPTFSVYDQVLTKQHDDDVDCIITRRLISNRITTPFKHEKNFPNKLNINPSNESSNNLNSVTIIKTYGDTYYSNIKNLATMKSIRNQGINEHEWKTCKSTLCNYKICPDSDSDYCAKCKCDHDECAKKGSHGVGGMFTHDMKKNEIILLKRFCNKNNISEATIDDFRFLQDMNIKYKYCKEHLFSGYIYTQCIRNTSLVKWRMQTDGITVNGRDVNGKIAMGSTDDPKMNVTISRCDGSGKYWLINGNRYSDDELQKAIKHNTSQICATRPEVCLCVSTRKTHNTQNV